MTATMRMFNSPSGLRWPEGQLRPPPPPARLRARGGGGAVLASPLCGFAFIAGANLFQRPHAVHRIGAPVAVGELRGLRSFEPGAVDDEAFADARNHRSDFPRQPTMAAGIFGALAIQIEMEFHRP